MGIIIEKNMNRFKAIFNAIAGLTFDGIIEIDHKGLRIKELDRSHITFVGVDLKPKFFYDFAVEEPVKLYIDFEDFNAILNRVQEDDLLYLGFNESKFIVILENAATRMFELNLIKQDDYRNYEEPELEFNAFTEVPSYIFKMAVEDAVIIEDKCSFLLDGDKLHLNTIDKYKVSKFNYLHGEMIKTNSKSMHSLEKLKQIVKVSEFADVVKIGMGNDIPISFKFEPDNKDGIVSFLLAPRIESEE